jgi:hypothetical protein
MEIALALLVAGCVALVVLAFVNRDKPAWRNNTKTTYILAGGLGAIGIVAWVLLNL